MNQDKAKKRLQRVVKKIYAGRDETFSDSEAAELTEAVFGPQHPPPFQSIEESRKFLAELAAVWKLRRYPKRGVREHRKLHYAVYDRVIAPAIEEAEGR